MQVTPISEETGVKRRRTKGIRSIKNQVPKGLSASLANGEKTAVVEPVEVDPAQEKRATDVEAEQDRHVLVATDEGRVAEGGDRELLPSRGVGTAVAVELRMERGAEPKSIELGQDLVVRGTLLEMYEDELDLAPITRHAEAGLDRLKDRILEAEVQVATEPVLENAERGEDVIDEDLARLGDDGLELGDHDLDGHEETGDLLDQLRLVQEPLQVIDRATDHDDRVDEHPEDFERESPVPQDAPEILIFTLLLTRHGHLLWLTPHPRTARRPKACRFRLMRRIVERTVCKGSRK